MEPRAIGLLCNFVETLCYSITDADRVVFSRRGEIANRDPSFTRNVRMSGRFVSLLLCNYATVGPIIIFRNGQFRYLWMIDAVVRQLSQLADANSLLLSRSGMIPLLSIAYVASRIPMIRHASRTGTPSFLHRHCRFRTILSIRVSTSLLFKKKKKGKKNRKKSWQCYYVTEKSIENNKGNA